MSRRILALACSSLCAPAIAGAGAETSDDMPGTICLARHARHDEPRPADVSAASPDTPNPEVKTPDSTKPTRRRLRLKRPRPKHLQQCQCNERRGHARHDGDEQRRQRPRHALHGRSQDGHGAAHEDDDPARSEARRPGESRPGGGRRAQGRGKIYGLQSRSGRRLQDLSAQPAAKAISLHQLPLCV